MGATSWDRRVESECGEQPARNILLDRATPAPHPSSAPRRHAEEAGRSRREGRRAWLEGGRSSEESAVSPAAAELSGRGGSESRGAAADARREDAGGAGEEEQGEGGARAREAREAVDEALPAGPTPLMMMRAPQHSPTPNMALPNHILRPSVFASPAPNDGFQWYHDPLDPTLKMLTPSISRPPLAPLVITTSGSKPGPWS
eukprot:1816899-Rhodomonas_salina.2